jgi:hypothetical protein
MVRFFENELGGIDPFYIEGQEQAIMQKKELDRARQKENVYANFVSTEGIDDFEDIQIIEQDNFPKITILYRKFHELPVKMRVDILYFLCQSKLD